MRRYRSLVFLVMLLLIGWTGSTNAQQKKATIHGQLVDVISYVKEGVMPTSPARKEIAMENLRKGSALGILEKGTKKLYLLAPAPTDTAFVKTVSAYSNVQTFVKGMLYKRAGMNVLVVEDIGKSLK
jgi:hypothetical protein